MAMSALVCAGAGLGVADRATAAQGCSQVTVKRQTIEAQGVAVEEIAARHGDESLQMKLLRAPLAHWDVRIIDMRGERALKASQGDYTSPAHSLNELAGLIGQGSIVAAAGMTESLSAPIPAGFLQVDGITRSRVKPSARVTDGVLCVRASGAVEILSERVSNDRRIPQDASRLAQQCRHAVQAGPVLVDSARAQQETRFPNLVPRLFGALDSSGNFVLGYAQPTTTFDLACVLADPGLRLNSAIALQSDQLGGVHFGRAAPLAGETWGSASASVASAIELRPASARQGRPAPSR